MQETRNKCFGSKKHSTTLLSAKGKYECGNIMLHLLHCCYIKALMLTYFHLTKGRVTFFRSETIVTSLLHLMELFFKMLFNHSTLKGIPEECF